MAISFDSIPANLRTPGCFIEFNNELAGATSIEFQAVMFAQKLSAGSAAANVPVLVTSPAQATVLFGRGSMAALMVAAYLAINSSIPLMVIPQVDLVAGTAAVGSITVDTAATGAGTLALYLGGVLVQVGVASGDAVDDIAIAIAAAINANADLPVTAAVDGVDDEKVNITARHKGEVFNGFDIRANYYGERMPAGVTVTCVSLTGGSGNPDMADGIDAMGDEWFNWAIVPYTDTANLTQLKTALDNRWGPMQQIGCRAFAAYAGTLANTGTFGNGHNSPHLSVMAIGSSPTPVCLAAAINAAVGSASLSIDPARPLQTLVLPGMQAPALADRWTRSERNILLYDGISTHSVDKDGTCRIERQITTYQTNAASLPDASYLDINTPETLERIRYLQRTTIMQKYPRHKLADDGTQYGAGQAIITPSIIKGELLALYRDMEELGWVEDFETYKANLIVERDPTDRNRINWRDTPNLVNQARVFAGKQQFIL